MLSDLRWKAPINWKAEVQLNILEWSDRSSYDMANVIFISGQSEIGGTGCVVATNNWL